MAVPMVKKEAVLVVKDHHLSKVEAVVVADEEVIS